MKRKPDAFYEVLLAAIIIAILLLSQLIGTTTVTDESANVDENGCPVTSVTLADLEAPGTKFGTLTIHEWEMELQKRFPEGEIRHYNSMSNVCTQGSRPVKSMRRWALRMKGQPWRRHIQISR